MCRALELLPVPEAIVAVESDAITRDESAAGFVSGRRDGTKKRWSFAGGINEASLASTVDGPDKEEEACGSG